MTACQLSHRYTQEYGRETVASACPLEGLPGLVFKTCEICMTPSFSWNYKLKINPLNPELNPICYLLALLAHHFLHVSRIMVKSLTLRLLMSYIYI